MIEVRVSTGGLDVKSFPVGRVIKRTVASVAGAAMGQMGARAPFRTGALRYSIRLQAADFEAFVGPEAPHTPYVVFGTMPHDIYPVNASCLAFEWRGGMRFFAHVHHPGTRPNPFIEESAEATVDMVPGIWENLFSEEVGE